jgi:hypothetical protein
MAVRIERDSRLRRLARSRALALLTLYAGAAVVATAPAVASFRSSFIAGGAEGLGGPGAGDHLQSVYRFWLLGHQLGNGDAPWRDPYSFQPLVPEQTVLAGWPFGIPFWPLEALFGPVVAWNTLQLAMIVVAGLATYGLAPARAPDRSGHRRRARLRARALPPGPERGPPPRLDRRPRARGALGVRALPRRPTRVEPTPGVPGARSRC